MTTPIAHTHLAYTQTWWKLCIWFCINYCNLDSVKSCNFTHMVLYQLTHSGILAYTETHIKQRQLAISSPTLPNLEHHWQLARRSSYQKRVAKVVSAFASMPCAMKWSMIGILRLSSLQQHCMMHSPNRSVNHAPEIHQEPRCISCRACTIDTHESCHWNPTLNRSSFWTRLDTFRHSTLDTFGHV